tara:strand:+ start:337 stop:1191 length:855 start_codon:yes stop_codon:yes gene_type:complete
MSQIKTFISLTRLNRPIGYMLLFWPCSWGLALAYNYEENKSLFFYYLLLFFLGSVLMRSAGCIFNDIVDKDIDKKVKRTKLRPIASGKINIKQAFVYVLILCFLSLIILLQFNFFTIFLGLASMVLAFSYPFMKRITYWPQLFLGLTFNWGIIMGWTAITGLISYEITLLYVSAIFWTLGYDTIYGAQDIVDDEVIGVKSTSIKFKSNIKLFVSVCYLISSTFLIISIYSKMNSIYSLILLIFFVLTLIYQIRIFDKNNPKTCLKAFKINNLSGLTLFTAIMVL